MCVSLCVVLPCSLSVCLSVCPADILASQCREFVLGPESALDSVLCPPLVPRFVGPSVLGPFSLVLCERFAGKCGQCSASCLDTKRDGEGCRKRGRNMGMWQSGKVVHGNCLALCTKTFLIFRACCYIARCCCCCCCCCLCCCYCCCCCSCCPSGALLQFNFSFIATFLPLRLPVANQVTNTHNPKHRQRFSELGARTDSELWT